MKNSTVLSSVKSTPARETAPSEAIQQVFRLAKRGWRLHPLTSIRKPFLDAWPERASSDPAQLEAWSREFPNCNWGVVTGSASGIFVMDADGLSGMEALDRWQKLHGQNCFNTLGVRTARGVHYYFLLPPNAGIRNSVSTLAEGIDIRGENGYVVVPPSVHEEGTIYTWLHGEDVPVQGPPSWLIEEVRRASSSRRNGKASAGQPIFETKRNKTLASLGGTMRRRGMTPQAIEAALEAENENRCKPRLESDEVRRIVQSISRYEPDLECHSRPPEYSDDALALQFSERHQDNFRYTAQWGFWHEWKDVVWRQDQTLRVFDLSRSLCREMSAACEKKFAPSIASAKTVAAIERLARSDRRHAATVDQWDADQWLLNTPGGLVDLQMGAIRPHRREDYCTKIAAVGPGGECQLWLAFLNRITEGNTELQGFLQRVCGYVLTGVTTEHALFFLYGTGANGKSVFLETLSGVLSPDYATPAPIETFLVSHNEQHPTDLASLRGARLVTAVETKDGRRWDESKLKLLTGGDKVKARFMRQDFFEYTPQFKLLIAGNNKPGLSKVDEAIRRRFHLIPFSMTIPKEERDPDLTVKLRAEWGGILQWMIEGCLDWQKQGLNPPPIVREATDEYLASEDAVGRWIEERCVTGNPNYFASSESLYESWKYWAEATGEFVSSQKRLSQRLDERAEFRRGKNSADKRGFFGIGLKQDPDTPGF